MFPTLPSHRKTGGMKREASRRVGQVIASKPELRIPQPALQ
jgi:hypothetical protein